MRYVLYVAVAVAVVFFALTRTEVGRDGLRREVERQFARSFDGELQIRELRGNLLNRLSADDVVVRDARGELIATIDSVVLHPSWRDLFNRTISTGRIELISPEIHLHRLDDGRWNVQTLLYPDRALSAPRDAWSFRATRVQLRNGRVVSRNMGDAPDAVRDGFLFDYTNVDIRDVDGRAVVEWGDAMRLIDILELDGSVPALGLDFSQVRGQVVLREGQFALNEFYARVGNSRMHLNGSIVGLADLAQRPDATEIELELTESSFNASELARIAPFLPLRDSLIVELRVRGPLSELVVENASFARGRSVVELEGTLVGLPDSVDFEAAVRPSTMAWSDFAAVWPTSGVEPFDHLGLVRWRGLSAGVLHWASDDLPSRLVGTLNLEAASELGALSTEGVFEYENGHELQARGSLRADSLDLGQVIKRPDLAGALNGQLEYDVRGGNLTGASGRLRLSLSESVFAHRAIDTLDVVIEGQRSDLRGRGAAVTEIGSIYATAAASLESMPSYTLTGKTTRLNLGPLLKADTLTTELNSTFRIQGQGSTLASLNGSFEVSMDTSVVAYGSDRRSLPPHRTALTIHQHDSGESRIDIDGDVLQFTATGDAGLASLTNLAAHWNEAISASLEHEQAKTRSAAMAPTVTGESTSLESVSRAPGRSEAGGFVD